MAFSKSSIDQFVERVWIEGDRHERHGLPWRYRDDPYQVYVSEAMLQQTQVARVMNFWPRFMQMFPTIDALASADVSDVLGAWQGLGYNRRALALKRAADECSANNKGRMPDTYEGLLELPGVGAATAAGIVAFAYNRPSVYIETNVRSVFIHQFFPDGEKVSDKLLHPLVEQTCSRENPRGWYYALLDWGAHLKSTGVNPSRRSAHYSRQGAFEGSRRQKRAFLLREVLGNPGISIEAAKQALDQAEISAGREAVDAHLFEAIVSEMVYEGFFRREGDSLVS